MDQRGLTLLEVLLSILLLSIILVTFMSFFSQSASFVKKNEDKFSASNIAQKVISILEDEVSYLSLVEKGVINDARMVLKPEIENNIEINNLLNLAQDINDNFKVILNFENVNDKIGLNLIQVKVNVYDLNENKESETFTYIRE